MSPLNKPASLLIDSRGAEMSDCKVSVISTSGQDIQVNLEVIEGGKFKADFLPYEVGECGLKWITCKHIRIMILFYQVLIQYQ